MYYGQQAYPLAAAQPVHWAQRHVAGKQYGLRGAESFWYILGCIGFGIAYFAKLPGKKAACEVFSELQLDGLGPSDANSLRGAETFWYVLMCLWFGAGYFAKVWAKKALWEVVVMVQSAPGEYAEAIIRALSGPAAPRRPGHRSPAHDAEARARMPEPRPAPGPGWTGSCSAGSDAGR